MLALLQVSDGDGLDNDELWVTGIFGGATLLLGASSVSGYGTARRCRAAIQDFYTARAHQQVAPPTYQAPPPPLAPPGAERGSCRPIVPFCDAGLVCASRYCVRPPGSAPIAPHL